MMEFKEFGKKDSALFIHETVLDRGSGYPVCSSMVFRSYWMGHSTSHTQGKKCIMTIFDTTFVSASLK